MIFQPIFFRIIINVFEINVIYYKKSLFNIISFENVELLKCKEMKETTEGLGFDLRSGSIYCPIYGSTEFDPTVPLIISIAHLFSGSRIR